MARRKEAREDLSRGALSTVAPQPEAPSTSYYTYGAIPSATVAADPEEDRRRIAEQQEQARRAEEARVAEQQRQQQLAEMQRQQALAAQQAEAARLAEVARQQEAARVAAQRAEAERVAAQRAEAERAAAQRAEAQRVAAQKAEAARVAAEQRRQADAARQAEEARQAQIARQAELDRLAQQEAARVAAEQEAARVAAEQAARVQEPVGALTAVSTPEPVGPSPLSVAEPPSAPPAAPPVVTQEPTPNIFVEGATTPESTGLNMGALDELFANLRKNQELQKLALEPGLLQQGFTGTSGVTTPPSGAGIQATPTRAEEPAIDFEVTPEMAGALQEVAKPAAITDAEREAVTSNPRVQALQKISDQLKANDFAGAFDSALAAERDLGGDFVGNIIDSNKLRELRGPMTADEIAKFYNEMPSKVFTERYIGPGNEFSKEQAIERNVAALGGQAGYVDPMLGVKAKETLLSKLPVKELTMLAAAAMGATAIPGLFGAGAGSGAGAGAGAGAAGGAGAGAAGAAGVVPTGLIPGAVSAAGLGTATFPIVASGGLTAAQLAALGAGAAGAAGAASGGAGATPTTPAEPGPLDEVVVTGTKAPAVPIVPPVVPPTTTPVTLPEAPPQFEEPPLEIADETPWYSDPLDEVIVQTGKPIPIDLPIPPFVPPLSTPVTLPEAPPQFEPTPEVGEEPPEEEGPLDEVVVETTKPTLPGLDLPPFVPPLETPVDLPTEPPQFEPPAEEPPEDEEPLDEVVVETTKPTLPELDLPPIVPPLKTPVDLPEKPPEFDTPTEAENPLKALMDKYANLENLLKLLGALGAAGAKTPTTPVTKPTAPSLGGALPKYVYTRKQLSPDIDYYTYGTRPEAKFFEDSMQLEQPTQPPLEEGPPASTPEEDKPMATGGLTGYAGGGSSQTRYFDGPGSGRDDKIPALLSDGEYVMDAETLALLGDGSTKEGARRMDQFRANIRKHKGRALSRGQISPDAKSPNKYMGGGLS